MELEQPPLGLAFGFRRGGSESASVAAQQQGLAMSATRTPAKHFAALAVGAPQPFRQLPVRLERMIHFVPPHNDKIRARLCDLIGQVDVVLGNLEDAIPADAKVAARRGFVDMARAFDYGQTGLW